MPALRLWRSSADVMLHESCQPYLQSEAVSRALTDRLSRPSFVFHSREEGDRASVRLSFEDVRCRLTTDDTNLADVQSTYAVTNLQTTNPEYVKIQAELNYAMGQLAQLQMANSLNPDMATGFVIAFWQGRVNRLRNQMNATPPFQTEPVIQPYTAHRYRRVLTMAISGVARVSDYLEGYSERLPVEGISEFTGEGLRDVLAADRQGLADQAPHLPPAEEASTQAIRTFLANGRSVAAQLLEHALIRRAAEAWHGRSPIDATGWLLFARDLGSESPPIPDLGVAVSDIKFGRMPALHVPNLQSTQTPTSSVAPPVATSRSAIIEAALPAVVRVDCANSFGSGFFVGESLVVTNRHVVASCGRIVVATHGGQSYGATLLKDAPEADLALLRVSGRSTDILSLGDETMTPIGADVVVIGTPEGLEGTVTRGILSAVRSGSGVKYLQVDAAISHGNSGGPLLDERGRVIGITTLKFVGNHAEALGFAVAVSELRRRFGEYLP